MFCKVRLAAIYLDWNQFAQAEVELAESRSLALQYNVRGAISDAQHVYARLHMLRGDIPTARAALTEAIELLQNTS